MARCAATPTVPVAPLYVARPGKRLPLPADLLLGTPDEPLGYAHGEPACPGAPGTGAAWYATTHELLQ